MEPWPAWDGRDFRRSAAADEDARQDHHRPHLPAGPWLRYRGHLDKFSDNLLSRRDQRLHRARSAGRRTRHGRHGQVIAAVARDYRAHGLRWVIVGDRNYGEGSSREHAALSPRLLGGAAVIARSFARIHESNL